jgi:hypothetical protein
MLCLLVALHLKDISVISIFSKEVAKSIIVLKSMHHEGEIIQNPIKVIVA